MTTLTAPLGVNIEKKYQNDWFSIERLALPKGKWYDSIMTHRDVVAVLPFLQDGETIVLVKQFRWPIMRDIWEVPAGMIEPGEDPERAALRELREETGYITESAKMWPMGTYFTSPGLTNEKIFTFLAMDCIPDPDRIYDESDTDHEEIGEVGIFPIIVPPTILDLKTMGLIETATSLLQLRGLG